MKERRLALGMTQEQLAKKTRPRMRREAITKIERGLIGVGPDVGARLARALVSDGETADDVYDELVSPPPMTWQQRVESLERDLQLLRDQLGAFLPPKESP